MSTNATVNLNTSANQALECAKKALLSFDEPQDFYAKAVGNVVFATVQYPLKENFIKILGRYACLITIQPISETSCVLSLLVDRILSTGAVAEGAHVHFIGELIKRILDNLQQPTTSR